MDSKTIIDRLGGPSEVSRICGVTPQAVSQWYGIGKVKRKDGTEEERERSIPQGWLRFLQVTRPGAFKEPEPEVGG